MDILMITKEGNSLALGKRLVEEGNKVSMFIQEEVSKKVGDGFVDKIKSWEDNKKNPDLIIFDNDEMGDISEELKKDGQVVWGGNKWSDSLELKREVGNKVFEKIGMKAIPSKQFKDIGEAIAYVKDNPKRYVIKLNGDIQADKTSSYVGKEEDGLDLISVMEHYQEKWAGKIESMQLQEFKKGIEVAIGGFFNGNDFVEPIAINFEHKSLMNENIGPATGEMGTSLIWMKKVKIFKESLGRMVDLLKDNKYVGFIDINCICEGKNLYPLEFTCRFGFPTLQLQLETIKNNMADWMFSIASGNKVNLTVSNPFSICVCVTCPPWPYMNREIYKKYTEGQEVIFKEKNIEGIQPGEIEKDSKGKWLITGEAGWAAVCTGQGKSIEEARKMAYGRVEKIIVPNQMYRTDIGEKTDENIRKLRSLGWFFN